LIQDKAAIDILEGMGVKYNNYKNKAFKTDEFDLDEQKIRHFRNMPSTINKLQIAVSEQNDELNETVNNFGI